MTSPLPTCTTLLLGQQNGVLDIAIDRPETRNALSDEVVRELHALAAVLAERSDIRAVTIRGTGGTFCAGGDIRAFRALSEAVPAAGTPDSFAATNREFGQLLLCWNALPQVTIALVEGAAFGGGLGLLCAVDLVLATATARFAVSETRLGVVPAQIAPFLVTRIGLAATRRAALTGQQFDGLQAKAIGLVNELYNDAATLDAGCKALVEDILRCAPRAVAATKTLLLRVGGEPLAPLMREAADIFADAARGPEGREGVTAFLEKRRPAWSLHAAARG